ncbi:MAG: hypothetical protein JNL62_17095 [Bryobacterales bacterium]|nr:hypothetical protein [Bryobacterales bacterium]
MSARGWFAAASCGLAGFAFLLNWWAGFRGIFMLDHSMVIDGGWRMLLGQVPYRDFLMPYSPLVMAIQALCFQVLGIQWQATVFPASVFNAGATLCAIRIVRLVGGGRVLALAAGGATALAFHPPFGTLWFEQTAVFFGLAGLTAMLEAARLDGWRRDGLYAMAGLLLAAGAIAKQNFGGLLVPIAFAVAGCGLFVDRRAALRGVWMAAGGFAAGIAAVIGWGWVYSDLAVFRHYVLEVAAAIGRSRMNADSLWKAVTFQAHPLFAQVDLIGIPAAVAALWKVRSRWEPAVWMEIGPAAVCALALPFWRSLLQKLTLNEWENNMALVGLSVCLAVRLTQYAAGAGRKWVAVGGVSFALWCVLPVIWISTAVKTRRVHDFAAGASFERVSKVPGLEGLRWGSTNLNGQDAFERVYGELRRRGTPFLVMGDSTILYALLGAKPPQPLLYFQPGHSFLEREVGELDGVIVESLRRNGVKTVVREKKTHLAEMMNVHERFPKTWAWFRDGFRLAEEFGNYEVWVAKD